LNALKDLHGDCTPSPSHQAVPANGIDSKYLGHLMLDGRPARRFAGHTFSRLISASQPQEQKPKLLKKVTVQNEESSTFQAIH